MEDYNKVSGMLSDQDIRHYWKKGIYVYDTEKKFDLEKQLQLGAIDLRFRNEYKKIELMGENQMLTYDIIHFLRREMLDFTAFPVFFVTNLLLVQRKKYYFNRATVSRNCSIVL